MKDDKEMEKMSKGLIILFCFILIQVFVSVGIGNLVHSAGVGFLVAAAFTVIYLITLTGSWVKAKKDAEANEQEQSSACEQQS